VEERQLAGYWLDLKRLESGTHAPGNPGAKRGISNPADLDVPECECHGGSSSRDVTPSLVGRAVNPRASEIPCRAGPRTDRSAARPCAATVPGSARSAR